jgi:hypothetical protein
MRKLIIALIFIMLASCAHQQRGGDLQSTRDSAYKVKVTLKLDLTPLNEWIAKKEAEKRARAEERKKKEDEAKREEARKRFPWGLWSQKTNAVAFLRDVPISLSVTQEMMELRVISQTQDTAEIGWSGTGWVAARAPGRSFMMTAGHVCESRETYDVEVYDIDWEANTIEFETIHLPIIEKKHVMMSRDGVDSVSGSVLRDEDMDDEYNGNDLCMLGIGADLGPAIPIANDDPDYGQACSVVGAPSGLWGGGIAVASEPLFSGRGSVFGVEPDGLAFNGLLAPGNSGSAVTCNGRVVGVISLGSTRFKSLIHAVPHESIAAFMKKALHRK